MRRSQRAGTGRMTNYAHHVRRALWLASLCLAAAAGNAQPTGPNAVRELAGEYRGTVKRTAMTVWAAPIAVPWRGQALALMLFPESERKDLVARLERLAGDQEALYRRACDGARTTEYGYDYNSAFSEIWNSGAALVFIHSGPARMGSLASGWRTATTRSGMVTNEEYTSLRGREYMVSRVRRDPETGGLTEVRLTQTGFIQNFFVNPALSLVRADAHAGVLELVEGYVKAKYAAWESLGIGRAQLPTTPPAVCR